MGESDNKTKTPIPRNSYGIVLKLDKDGDAYIKWDVGNCWLKKKNWHKVRKAGAREVVVTASKQVKPTWPDLPKPGIDRSRGRELRKAVASKSVSQPEAPTPQSAFRPMGNGYSRGRESAVASRPRSLAEATAPQSASRPMGNAYSRGRESAAASRSISRAEATKPQSAVRPMVNAYSRGRYCSLCGGPCKYV